MLLEISTLTLSSALLVACGGGHTSTTAPATAPTAPAASVARTSPAASVASASAPASAAASAAASASSSSSAAASNGPEGQREYRHRGEMQAAFEAAGISNAARVGARGGNRPTRPDRPDLRQAARQLAKYNPGPGVVDQIIAVLTLQ
ncbi:MAG: hypothetical protein U0232_21840 [Thermomicrobiales bacterium]